MKYGPVKIGIQVNGYINLEIVKCQVHCKLGKHTGSEIEIKLVLVLFIQVREQNRNFLDNSYARKSNLNSQWLSFSPENHVEILVQDPLEEKQNLRKCTRKKTITNNSGMVHVIDSFKGNVCSWLWLHLLAFFPNRLKENGREISFTKARKDHLQSILNSQMN